jgi:hypothetical protein
VLLERLEPEGFAVVEDALERSELARVTRAVDLTDVPDARHGAMWTIPGSHVRDTLDRRVEPPDAVPLLVRIRPRDELELGPGTLERLDPVRRQLLGWGTSGIGHWIPTADDVPLRTSG